MVFCTILFSTVQQIVYMECTINYLVRIYARTVKLGQKPYWSRLLLELYILLTVNCVIVLYVGHVLVINGSILCQTLTCDLSTLKSKHRPLKVLSQIITCTSSFHLCNVLSSTFKLYPFLSRTDARVPLQKKQCLTKMHTNALWQSKAFLQNCHCSHVQDGLLYILPVFLTSCCDSSCSTWLSGLQILSWWTSPTIQCQDLYIVSPSLHRVLCPLCVSSLCENTFYFGCFSYRI